MYRLISSLILVICLAVTGSAEQKLLRISTFSGLNTASSDFTMKPGDARQAHNIDFGRNVGSWSKRYGYEAVSYLAGMDSIVGLYGAYYSDGTQQLILVGDSAYVGWGSVYASPKGKAQFSGASSFGISIAVPMGSETIYLDSIIIDGDTTVISYTKAATVDTLVDTSTTCYSKPGFEDECWTFYDTTLFGDSLGIAEFVASNLVDSINANASVSDSVLAILGSNGNYKVEPIGYEFYTITIPTDANQTVTTTTTNSSKIWDYFSVLNKPSFAMFGDVVYGVNGSHKGIAYNGDVARSWPMNAPGEPTIVPITTSGPLDGEYRYAFTYLRGLDSDSSYGTVGTVTAPVRVNSGQMLLRGFQWVGADTIDAAPDTVGVVVYRTRAYPKNLDQRDSAFLIDTVWGTSSANLATKTLIDSVADGDLGAGLSIWTDAFVGRDSTEGYDHRYGAPTFLKIVSTLAYTTVTDSTVAVGIYHGIPDQVDTLGVQYICTFMDTVFGTESNASPPLSVMQGVADAKARAQTIGLPTPVSTDSGVVRNLYRAHILQVTRDSAFNFYDSTDRAHTESGKNTIVFIPSTPGLPSGYQWRLAIDTVVLSNYRLVAQVSMDSTSYTDSIRWDSMQVSGHPIYVQSTPPPFLTKIFPHDGRMFGVSGSRLYQSKLDSAAAWGATDFISLDESDGDIIIDAFVSRGVIRVLKNHSTFNVYQNASFEWERQEVSGYWGDIAAKSHAAGPLGHYYLSSRGVLREAEGQFLERTQAIELISAPLDNFTALPITTLDDAVGFYFDQKYMLSIGDTTYVYDERAKTWGTWSMTFADATLYGTESALNFLPGDSMYFIQSGNSDLYRYGTSEQDKGASFQSRWRSGAILHESPGYKQIQSVEMAFSSGEPGDTVLVGLYNESDAQILNIGAVAGVHGLVFDTLSNRYQRISVNKHAGVRYYEILLASNAVGSSSTAIIDLLDIWYTEGITPTIY